MHIGQRMWRRAGIGTKLALTNFFCVTGIVVVLVACIGWAVHTTLHKKLQNELEAGVATVGRFIASSDQDVRQRTLFLSRSLAQALSGTVQLQGDSTAPVLSINGQTLDSDDARVANFTRTTGAVATVFVRKGSDYLRVNSSLQGADGQRVVGTTLDTSHPAYAALQGGTTYMGLATLFGRQYMTHYAPLKDAQGQVVGALFVGQDFSEALNGLRDAMRALKVGDGGYYFVLRDDAAGPPGMLVVHPSQEGTSILGSKDSNGREFIREMLERKQGVITYPWTNPGETAPREKIAAFGYYAPWNWVYASSAYVDEFVAETRRMILAVAALGIAAVLVLSGMWWLLVRRMIVRPLGQISGMAKALAAGDLTVQVQHARLDELGQLMDDMNHTARDLTTVVSTVQSRAQGVASASAQIAQGNMDLASRTESEASALEETAAAMEQLGSTVAHNADHAKSADHLTRAAQQVVTEGGDAVREVVQTMQGIDASSKKIADIIGVIDSIAFQTNILALNAAVEAARAGENGRGFAVVAGEVRQLASRSAEAAKQIKQLIQNSVSEIHQGNVQAARAGQTMEQAMAEIQKVTNLITDISHASLEQSSGVAQVGEAVANMDQSTQKNAALVEEMASAAESLRHQSAELLQAVSVFRTQAAHEATPPAPALAPARMVAAPRTAGAMSAPPAKATAPARSAAPAIPVVTAGHPATPVAAPARPQQKPAAAAPVLAHQYDAQSDDWENF